jgi:hypothetical protein
MNDAARFLPDDPDELVAASFACPVCLHRATYTRLAAYYDEPEATCACLPCGCGWEIALSAVQMLRLTLAPPHGLVLERGGSLSF